jgi:hypothetical protein
LHARHRLERVRSPLCVLAPAGAGGHRGRGGRDRVHRRRRRPRPHRRELRWRGPTDPRQHIVVPTPGGRCAGTEFRDCDRGGSGPRAAVVRHGAIARVRTPPALRDADIGRRLAAVREPPPIADQPAQRAESQHAEPARSALDRCSSPGDLVTHSAFIKRSVNDDRHRRPQSGQHRPVGPLLGYEPQGRSPHRSDRRGAHRGRPRLRRTFCVASRAVRAPSSSRCSSGEARIRADPGVLALEPLRLRWTANRVREGFISVDDHPVVDKPQLWRH